MATQIFFDIPAEILNTQTYDKIKVLRNTQEQGDYTQVALIDSKVNGVWINSYNDITQYNGTDKYYLIRFSDSLFT